MKVKVVAKTVLLCSLSYYLISRLKLSIISLSFSNKNALFLLINSVVLLTVVINKFCSVFVTTDDDRLTEELMPYQSDDITIQEVPNNYSANDEILVEEKYVILVEKFAREDVARAEEEEEEEEIIFDTGLNKEADTGWRHDLIRKPVQRLELLMVEDLAPKVKEIVCVDEKWKKLDDSDAVNRKYEEFIRVQRRKWRLDAV